MFAFFSENSVDKIHVYLLYFDIEQIYTKFLVFGEMKSMKSTGIVRKVDSLGRIVLPIELRRVMGIDIKDPIEIFVDDSHIVLGKYQPACIFCDSVVGVSEFKGAKVCADCFAKLRN